MVVTREQLVQQINALSEPALQQVATCLSFLEYQERFDHRPKLDEAQITALYAEFADEDRELAEVGMADYAATRIREDAQ